MAVFDPRGSPLALHFGSLETRLLELRGGPGRWRVTAAESFPARGRTRHAEAAAAIKPRLKALRLRQKDAAVALAGDTVSVSLVPVDEHSRPRLAVLLQETAVRAVQDDEGVVFRSLKLATGGHEGGTLRDEYLLLAVGQSEIRRCQEALRALGMRPVGLEMNAFPVARALHLARPEVEAPWAYLHLGFSQGLFGIVDGGEVRFLKPLQVSGERLLETIQRRLARGGDDAAPSVSDLLSGGTPGTAGQAGAGEDAEPGEDAGVALAPVPATATLGALREAAVARAQDVLAALHLQAASLAAELRACMRHFASRFPGRQVSDVRLTGFGADLPGVDEALTRALGLPVTKARPFTELGIRAPDSVLAEEARWTAALGLALRSRT